MRTTLSFKNQQGMSLVEMVLVIATVGFLVLLVANLPSSIASITKSRNTSIARDIVNKQTDYLRRQTYTNLAIGTNSFSDTSLTSLPGSTASYNIEECPPEVCQSSESIKKVTVQVLWKESGETKKVEVVTLVGLGGLGQY